MMIVMKAAATEDEVEAVVERVEGVGARAPADSSGGDGARPPEAAPRIGARGLWPSA